MAIVFAPVSGIRIVRGTTWRDDVQLVDADTQAPVNLIGVLGLLMRVRATISGPILLELSLASSGLPSAGRLEIVDPNEGLIGFRVDSATTLTLPENDHRRAKYRYDAVIERTAGEYEAAISGKLTVLPQYTRPWGTT